jgi:hypothetical protein
MGDYLYTSLDAPVNRIAALDARPRTPKLKSLAKVIYTVLTSAVGSSEYEASEFDLTKVRDTVNGESIFRRVIDKYQEQIWNNGWKFVGKEKTNVNYINQRFKEISHVSGIPTGELFERITRQLVTYSNAFVVKVRNKDSSSGRIRRTTDGKKLFPVAAYFPQPAEYMQIQRDKKGKIKKYRLAIKPEIEWPPEDVIHISIYRQEGYSFGTPMVAPVISDIAALRQVENSTNLMVFQHTIPILHFAVGTDDDPGEQDEITDVNLKVEDMATYGHLVTSNRVRIDIIGAGREMVDTIPILEYWKKRVYSGLGVSGVGLGETDTSNRGTATTVISEFHNTATHFQKKIANSLDEFFIKELLAEKGLNALRITDKQRVFIHLPEIDLDTKIKNETHLTFLYEHNAITEDEMRVELGREPLNDSEREETFLNRVAIPKLLASKGITFDEEGTALINNLEQPTNQFGKKSAPTLPKND